MKKLGMNAILAVGGGSERPPRLLVLQYHGAGKRKSDGPIALVGKGVCFDAGGLCLKRPGQMITMKGDMAGGAAVVGAIRALAQRKAKVDVVGVVGLVENLPSSSAYKPGDIVKTMAGHTIEVIDTDAEGRLVLVDALHYAATRFKPRCIIDLATLTYAVMAAVGGAYAGIFSTDDRLAKSLTAPVAPAGRRLLRRGAGIADRRLPASRHRCRQRRCRPCRGAAEALRGRSSLGASRHRQQGVHRQGPIPRAGRRDRVCGRLAGAVRRRPGIV